MSDKIRVLDPGSDREVHASPDGLYEHTTFNTLCGWCDIDYEEVDASEKITCSHCIAVIEMCKGIKRSEYTKHKPPKEARP